MNPRLQGFKHRVAVEADIPAIIELMQRSIRENMKHFLSSEEIEATQESMGVDATLIEDGTYFVIEAEQDGETVLVGCGGWGKRRTLYGGNHTNEAARIRAMYTHPSWVRRGIGSLLLELGEAAARDAGYKTIELGSTVPGEPLYAARGYREVSRETQVGANGADNIIIKMVKDLR